MLPYLNNQETYSIQDAANFLGISPQTLRRLEERGILIPERTEGNHRRYTQEALATYKKNKKRVGTSTLITPQVRNFGSEATATISNTSSQPGIQIISPTQPIQKQPSLNTVSQISNQPVPSVTDQLRNIIKFGKPQADLVQEIESPFPLETNGYEVIENPEQSQPKSHGFPKKPSIIFSGVLAVILLIFFSLLFFNRNSSLKTSTTTSQTNNSKYQNMYSGKKPLTSDLVFKVEIPSIFGGNVEFLQNLTVDKNLTVKGKAIFNSGISTNNQNIDAGNGTITASNVLYGIKAGTGISVTAGQTPTISNSGVTSLQNQTGSLQLTAGSGISISGLTISATGANSSSLSSSYWQQSGNSLFPTTLSNDILIGGNTLSSALFSVSGTTGNVGVSGTVNFSGLNASSPVFTDASKNLTNTGILDIGHGGTGQTSFSSNAVLFGNGTGPLNSTSPPTAGQVLMGNLSGVPTFTTLTGGISVDGAGNVSIGSHVVTLGPNTTGNYQSGTTAGNGISVSGTPDAGWSPTIAINLTSSGVSSSTSANSGLESTASGLSLLRGCGNGQILKWDADLDLWECNNDAGAGSNAIINVTGNSYSSIDTSTLNFSNDFSLNESPLGQTNIAIDYATSYITRSNQNETISGVWNFSNGIGIGTTTPGAQLNISSASTGKALAIFNEIGDQNILTASSSGNTVFTIDNTGAIITGSYQGTTIAAQYGGTGQSSYTAGDLLYATGATSLGKLSAGSGNNGRVLTVVAGLPVWASVSGGVGGLCTDCVINDPSSNAFNTITPTASNVTGLSVAQASGGNVDIFNVTNNGGGTTYLQVASNGNILLPNSFLGIGTTSPISLLDTEGKVTGKALVSLNETGNQNILTASASGTTVFTLDRSGNLNSVSGAYQIAGNSVLSSTTLGTGVTSSSLTTVGTLTSGTWNATLITSQYGGTGFNNSAAAQYALPYYSATGVLGGTLAVGTTGQCLVGNTTAAPSWSSCTGLGTNYFQRNTTTLSPATASDSLLLADSGTTTNFRLEVNGKQTGKALVSLNETGNQNILTASASGTTVFTLDRSGNLNSVSGAYQIAGNSVLSSTTLGTGVTSSSLTTVGTLTSGTWNATLITSQYGGTGFNNSAAAQYALPYYSATGVLGGTLAVGTTGQCLVGNSNGQVPQT